MRSLKFLILFHCSFLIGVVQACDDKSMTWQTGQPSSIQKYYSPSPRYNIMAPDKSQLLQREISDLFLQEDQSNYDLTGGANAGVRTDVAIEDYFSQKFALAGEKFQTYNANRDDIDALMASSGNMRPLNINDVTSSGEIIAYYNLKMTGGLIFRTDQIKCQTPYSHPMTMHEAFGMSDTQHTNNHSEYVNPEGSVIYDSTDNYCFFLLIPKSENLGPYLARVHQDDWDSRYYIYRGMAPYLRINPDLHPKLAVGQGDLHFVKGRYILPGQAGQFLIPQNGLNLLFNRVVIYRPYHHDRYKVATGSELAWEVYQDLGNMPPSKPAGDNWNEKMTTTFEITGTNLNMTGMQIEASAMAEHHLGVSDGTKQSFGSGVGVQYMALGPEVVASPGDPRKWQTAMHFPDSPREEAFFAKALNSDFDGVEVNHNRKEGRETDATQEYAARALDKTELNEHLMLASAGGDDRKLFQLWMKSDYNMDGSLVDLALGPGSTTIPCADAEGQVKNFCDEFVPGLVTELEAFFSSIGISLPSPPYEDTAHDPDDLNNILGNLTNPTVQNIGGKSYNVQAELPQVINALQSPLNAQLDAYINATVPNPFFNKFLFQTEEGQKIQAMRSKLQNGLAADDQLYSDLYFAGSEDADFRGQITSIASGFPTSASEQGMFLTTNMIPLMTKYNTLENDPMLSGSFRYYTAKENDGKQLLSRLYIIAGTETANQASAFEDVEWGNYRTPSLDGTCASLQDPNSASEAELLSCLNALSDPSIVLAPEIGYNQEHQVDSERYTGGN